MIRSRLVDSRHPRRLFTACALLPLALAMTGSFASAADVVVRYHSTDLATDAGARHLLSQIETAAHGACFDLESAPLTLREARKRCFQAAVSHAVDAVNAGKVTAAYVAKYGPPVMAGIRDAHPARLRAIRGT